MMLMKADDAVSMADLERRIAKLEGTQHAHTTLIKALDEHTALLTRMVEVLSRQVVALKQGRWSDAN